MILKNLLDFISYDLQRIAKPTQDNSLRFSLFFNWRTEYKPSLKLAHF
jgi:hypothetical protein